MIDCSLVCGKIVADQSVDCSSAFVKAVEQSIMLINRCDITGYTVDATANSHKLTSITLETAQTGYLITGIPGKNLFFGSHSVNVNDDAPDDFVHTIGLRGYNLTEANLNYIKQLGKGADLVAIVVDKTDPTNVDKYKVYGIENGLKLGEYSQNTNENSGAFIYTLTSRAPDFESCPPYVWLETDIATTDAKYSNKLLGA